jgi:hypothetical protein
MWDRRSLFAQESPKFEIAQNWNEIGEGVSDLDSDKGIFRLHLELLMSSLMILFVLSMNSVSFGDILWKTTFWIDDFPDLLNPNKRILGFEISAPFE